MVEEGEPWPFGQWAHGPQGVFQYYRELLKTSDLRVITTYLDYVESRGAFCVLIWMLRCTCRLLLSRTGGFNESTEQKWKCRTR
jgi:hypothetical protein